MADSFNSAQFVGYQRASFAKAQCLRVWVLLSQFLIAAIAAVSVFSNDSSLLLYLAAAGGVLLIIWLTATRSYRRYKTDGDQARRACLVLEGFPDTPSPAQLFQIYQSFNVDESVATQLADLHYFATTAAKGPSRLAEMLEESAFWTEKLQEESGRWMALFLALIAFVATICGLLLMPSNDTELRVSLARVFLALLPFFLSSEVFGALEGHRAAAHSICKLRLRLNAAQGRDAQMGDVVLLLLDYNAAVEAAPMNLPYLYELRKKRLGESWNAYLTHKANTKKC
jgi:hypothetical protein